MEHEHGPEQQGEVLKSAELEPSKEALKSPEAHKESQAEREHKIEEAREKVEQQKAHEHSETHKEPVHKRLVSALDRNQAYAETMASIQRHLSSPSRAFSKVIHNPAVEKTSEALGKTVMRPSVTLGATTTALLIGAFTYLVAKHYGYTLSGSEILLSLVLGGIIGAIIEGITKLFRPKE